MTLPAGKDGCPDGMESPLHNGQCTAQSGVTLSSDQLMSLIYNPPPVQGIQYIPVDALPPPVAGEYCIIGCYDGGRCVPFNDPFCYSKANADAGVYDYVLNNRDQYGCPTGWNVYDFPDGTRMCKPGINASFGASVSAGPLKPGDVVYLAPAQNATPRNPLYGCPNGQTLSSTNGVASCINNATGQPVTQIPYSTNSGQAVATGPIIDIANPTTSPKTAASNALSSVSADVSNLYNQFTNQVQSVTGSSNKSLPLILLAIGALLILRK